MIALGDIANNLGHLLKFQLTKLKEKRIMNDSALTLKVMEPS